MKNNADSQASNKIGAGHVQAMGRLGLAELRNAASMEGSNVAAPSEAGLFGTATPSEVVAQRSAEQRAPAMEGPAGDAGSVWGLGTSKEGGSVLDGRVHDSPAGQVDAQKGATGRPDPGMERE